MNKKKILVCSEFFEPDIGGAQEIAKRIALILSEDNEVHILTSYNSARLNINDKYHVHHFRVTGNYVNGIKGDKNIVLNFLKNENFDQIIFYAAQQWTFDIFLKYDYLFNKNTRYFLIPCGFSKINFPHYYFYFKKIVHFSKYIEKFIFHTKNGKDFIYLSNKIKKNQIKIIKNGFIDNIPFKSVEIKNYYHMDANTKIIPYIANFNYLKGQIRLLKIFNNVKTKTPINLIFYSKSNFYDRFFYYRFFLFYKKFFFKNDMINISIHFDAPREYIETILKNSFLFLFCSRFEYSPLVIFEAIKYTLPVISYDVGDVNEVVKKNKFGLVVNNNKKFVSCLNRLLENDQMLTLFKNNIKRNKDLYSWSNISKKYVSIFK